MAKMSQRNDLNKYFLQSAPSMGHNHLQQIARVHEAARPAGAMLRMML